MSARILVIEDNPDNMELMTYLLRAYGHTALAANDGESGVEMTRRELPDLILCDIHLPKMDGYQLIRELKGDAASRRIPIVAVTALAMVGDREKMMAAGFDGYIAKPIMPETFIGQVEEFLRKDLRSQARTVVTETEPEPDPPKDRVPRGAILVVDDSEVNRELVRSILEPSGYAVTRVPCVRLALEAAQRNAFDLFVCDLHLPDVDGWDFLRTIKADPRLKSIPVMILTASVWGETDRARAQQMGANCFVMRPIEAEALLHEIESCLGQSQGDR